MGVIVSVADVPVADRRGGTGHPPETVQQAIQAMGGDVVCVEDSLLGRVTSLRLGIAGA